MPILQLILQTPWYLLLVAFVLSLGAAAFWWIFFKQRSPEFTTANRSILLLFLVGLIIVIPLALVESSIVAQLPQSYQQVLASSASAMTPQRAGIIALVMFLIVGPLEELSKLFFLRQIMPLGEINQVIDSVKFGIAIGIGFAIVENSLFLLAPLAAHDWRLAATTYFLRFFFSALAHGVYSGIGGYFLGCAKAAFWRRRQNIFAAIVLPILAHGTFNTLLLLGIGYYALPLLLIFLAILLRWYQNKQSHVVFGSPSTTV